jgi:hypothetical protein
MDINDISIKVLLGAGIVGAIILMIRQTILSYFSAKNQVVANSAQDNIIDRLETEITRLELIIEKQHTAHKLLCDELSSKIRHLERQMGELREIELQDAADIMEISIIMQTFCTTCINDAQNEQMSRVKVLLDRLRARRVKVQSKGEGDER